MSNRHLGGWWRLWIILSALWLIFVVGISIHDFRWPDLAEARSRAVSNSCTVYRGEDMVHLLDHYTEAELHTALRERKPGTEQWMDSLQDCVQALDADYSAQRDAAAIGVARFGVIAGLLPPALLLLLGLAAHWIIRGFRHPQK